MMELIKVLLVEDNPGDARLVREILTEAKASQFELIVCEQLSQALELLIENSFDVILLDLLLPDSRGLDTFIETNGAAHHIPIIVISGLSDEETAIEAVHKGAQDYLVKGQADGSLMERSIRYSIERKRAQKEIENGLEKLRRTLAMTIQVLATTVETRDPYTAGHQRRVADLACAIATEMGLSEDEIDGIRMAGIIHDLGKLMVPAEILSKPGKISTVEYDLIKTHPTMGYEILKDIEFPWPVAQIVLQHHERLDGSGYPTGTTRSEIIMEARVLAVADVVEAMASYRPYRPGLGIDKAIKEINDNRGTLYDSTVVDACLECITRKGFEFNQGDA